MEFTISVVSSITIIVFLIIIAKMVFSLRKIAIKNFKFKKRLSYFKQNQYHIESLSFYLLVVVISEGIIKLPFKFYLILY